MKKLFYFFSSTFLAVLLFASVNVIGQNPFYINLLQPNNSASTIEIVIGENYLISWDDNLTQPVDIFFASDGTNYTQISPVGTGITGSTWLWDTDGLAPSPTCKIRVKSHVSPSTYYTDNVAAFSLVNYASDDEIVVEQPSTTSISWAQGSTHTIYWRNTFANDNVKVEYTHDGTSWETITGGSAVVGNSIDWVVPNHPSTTCKVRVTSNNHSGLTDPSDNNFTITLTSGTVQEIYQPNTSSVWDMDKKYLISWKDDLTEPVDIYIKDITAGTAKEQIGDDILGSTWEWNLAAAGGPTLVNEHNYKVIIQSNVTGSTEYLSDQFSIVKVTGGVTAIYQPKSDNTTSWTRGTRHLISWLDNLEGTVDVLIYKGSLKAQFNDITGTTFYWDIPSNYAAGSDYTVVVRSHDDPFSSPMTSGTFSVTESSGTAVTVVQPSISGLNWAYNTTHLISWDDDFPENVKIELVSYTNAAATTGEIVLGTPIQASIASSTYVWDIDATSAGYDPALYYKVKITSVNDDNITDMSDNTFTINSTAGTYVDVLSPDGGEYWMAGTSHLISWIDDLPENVKINLYLYTAPSTYTKVDGAGLTDGTTYSGSTMTWTIPQSVDAASNYRVGIKSTLDTTIVNYSAANFDIVPYGKSSKSNVNLDLVKVYPNPASGSVNILAPANISNVEVRNLLGQVVYTNTMEASQATIDVSSFDTGIYVVNISIEGNVVTKKLFVQ